MAKDRTRYGQQFFGIFKDDIKGSRLPEWCSKLVGQIVFCEEYVKDHIDNINIHNKYHILACDHNNKIEALKKQEVYTRDAMCFPAKFIQRIESPDNNGLAKHVLRKE